MCVCSGAPVGDSGSLRALLPCGHAVTPETLFQWCRTQLEEVSMGILKGQSSEFSCLFFFMLLILLTFDLIQYFCNFINSTLNFKSLK